MNGAIAANGFVILWDELKRRFLAPVRHVTFWVYLILAVIIFGGFPIWLEVVFYFNADIHESTSHLRTALVAFFPALIGSVSFQLIFEEVGRNKRMLAFAMFVVVFFSLIGVILILARSIADYVAIPVAFGLCAFAVLEWWIANGLNPTFQDDLDVEAPVGGPPSHPPAGDLTGFRT
jgi:hypothetical protein